MNTIPDNQPSDQSRNKQGNQKLKKERRPTMMDVASMADVSQATVSLVLNGSPGAKLSESTRKRVFQAAKELGYELVRSSQRPPPNEGSTIAFIVDDCTTDPWMALAFEGARDKALEFGINVCLFVSRGDADTEAKIVRQMNKLNLLGIIYGTILTRRVDISPALDDQHVVLLNCYDENRTLPSVVPGDLLGGRMATDRLIKAGYDRIGFINGQQGIDTTRDRFKGYKQALSSSDIPFEADLVRSGNWEPSSGYALTLDLLSIKKPPKAIFCANDLMAIGCYDALNELGLSVPDDIAVVGFDDRDIAQHMHPPLTTLILPHFEMGEIAAEKLIDSAGGLKAGSTQIKVECALVDRESVGQAE